MGCVASLQISYDHLRAAGLHCHALYKYLHNRLNLSASKLNCKISPESIKNINKKKWSLVVNVWTNIRTRFIFTNTCVIKSIRRYYCVIALYIQTAVHPLIAIDTLALSFDTILARSGHEVSLPINYLQFEVKSHWFTKIKYMVKHLKGFFFFKF